MMRWRWTMFGMLLTAAALAGCSNKEEMRWKEQVWLSDGRRIDVDRYSVALKSGFPNSTDGPPVYQEINYSPLGVHWSTKSSNSRGASDLLSFDIINKDAYLVVYSNKKRSDYCVNKRSGEYLIDVYRWRNGISEKVDQKDAPIDRMGLNLSGTGNWGFRHADKPVNYLSWNDVAYATGQLNSGHPKLLSDLFKETPYSICN